MLYIGCQLHLKLMVIQSPINHQRTVATNWIYSWINNPLIRRQVLLPLSFSRMLEYQHSISCSTQSFWPSCWVMAPTSSKRLTSSYLGALHSRGPVLSCLTIRKLSLSVAWLEWHLVSRFNDIQLPGSFTFPRTSAQLFNYQKIFLVGGLIRMTFG